MAELLSKLDPATALLVMGCFAAIVWMARQIVQLMADAREDRNLYITAMTKQTEAMVGVEQRLGQVSETQTRIHTEMQHIARGVAHRVVGAGGD